MEPPRSTICKVNRFARKRQSQPCSECNKSEPAYKCPTCFTKYCSTDCFKSHKSHCETSTSKSSDKNESGASRYTYAFPSADTVPVDKLLETKNDERIQELLKSAKLRAMITTLDDSQNPTKSLNEVMKDPEFRAFSNVVLEIVGVQDEYDFDQ